MSAPTSIPADAARRLREALCHELGGVGEEMASLDRNPDAHAWGRHLGYFDALRAALDELGWSGAQGAEIDLDRHRRVIVDALSEALEGERHLIDEAERNLDAPDAEDQRREAQARADVIEAWAESAGLDLEWHPRPHRVVASAELAPIVLESLLEAFRGAVEGVEQCGMDPDGYTEALAHFDAIRAALDSLGWGEHADLDLDAHRDVFQSALAERLSTERDMTADALDAIGKGHTGGEQQRQRTYRNTVAIESLMHEAGLQIPPAGDVQ